MKIIPLYGVKAAGRVALVDDEDYPVISRYRWNVQYEERPGRDRGPYAVTAFDQRGTKRVYIRMHCFILGRFTGIDHRNGNGLDNQKNNLRIATPSQNAANRGALAGTSQYKGVGWHRQAKKWRAKITVNGEHRSLGLFLVEEDAARAYDVAAQEAWGEFAWQNFPESGIQAT